MCSNPRSTDLHLLCLLAKRITNETYNWVSDPRWHPSGNKIIATKWYFSSRSLGAGEGWEYNVPGTDSEERVTTNAGRRLISRDLPFGWPKSDYAEQQIGYEQFLWAGDDVVIYAGNVKDVPQGTFQYGKGKCRAFLLLTVTLHDV